MLHGVIDLVGFVFVDRLSELLQTVRGECSRRIGRVQQQHV